MVSMPTLFLGLGLLIASHLFTLAAALLLGAAVPAGGLLAGAAAVGLLLLPPPLLASLTPQRAVAVPLGLGLWGLAILLAVPALLPYPAAQAIDAGLGLVGGGCPGIGQVAYRVLPDLSGSDSLAGLPAPPPPDCPPPAAPTPAAAAVQVPTEPATLTSLAGPGDVVIPYTAAGSAIVIPVAFEDASGSTVTLPMLFDTGATLTTLDRASMAEVGLTLAPDAPEITSQTAGGERKSRVTLSPGLSIGGHRVDGVTVSQCEPCADAKARGLLGMNVSGRFLITIDTQAQQLILRPRAGEQTRDVEPWLEISASALQGADGRVEMTLTAQNKSHRAISRARVRVTCGVDSWVDVQDIPPGGSASTSLILPEGSSCPSYRLALDQAYW